MSKAQVTNHEIGTPRNLLYRVFHEKRLGIVSAGGLCSQLKIKDIFCGGGALCIWFCKRSVVISRVLFELCLRFQHFPRG